MALATSNPADDPMAVGPSRSSTTPSLACLVQPEGSSKGKHSSEIQKAKSESPETPLNEPDDRSETQAVSPAAVAVAQSDAGADPVEEIFCEYPPPPEPTTEFDRKYPSDRFDDEVTDNARVWKIYRDEAMTEDRSMLDGWNKTLDILLIFAGLFSAVSTAFIIESYKLLQPDYTQYIAQALFTLSTQNGSDTFSLARVKLTPPSAFDADPSSRWVNGLWFVSLGLSLSVALLCILAKQWLEEYHTRITAPSRSPRHWSRRHVQYKDGLAQWHIPAFISVLPAVLHASLFLFLAGLYVFLSSLDGAIAVLLLCVSVPLLAFYLASILVPLFADHCPWSTTLVGQILRLSRFAKRQCVSFILKQSGRFVARTMFRHLTGWLHDALTRSTPSRRSGAPDPLAASDASLPLSTAEGKAIEWLVTTSPSSDIVSVAVQAIGSLHPYGDTMSFLCSSTAARLARSVAVKVLNAALDVPNNVDPMVHARMRRVVLCLSESEYDFHERYFPNTYDLSVLSKLRRSPSNQLNSPVPRQFDTDSYLPAFAYIREIESCMKRAACSAINSDGRHPYLPSTALLLLLHVSSVPLLVYAFHTYRRTWSQEPLSVQVVLQCTLRALSLDGITPSQTGSCRGCLFGLLELWCQILSLAETWSFDSDGLVILEEDIRWLARITTDKQVYGYDCPAGFKHSLTHFSFAIDICASKMHPLPDLPVSVLAAALPFIDDAQPSSSHGPELWYPSAARVLVNITHTWWNFQRGILPTPGSARSLQAIVELHPISMLLDAVCHPGNSEHQSFPGGHPRCLWQVVVPSPCHWEYSESAAWNDPTCFLRSWDGLPSAWRLLHEIDTSMLELLRFGDVLATQLCSMRRSGHDASAAVTEFFVFDSCLDYLRGFCVDACATKSDSSTLFSGLEAVFSKRSILLRFMQHCIELFGRQWWTNGFSTFQQSSPEEILNVIANSGRSDKRPSQESAQIVHKYRAFVAELDAELRRRGRCMECPEPAITGQDSARDSRDVESQCLARTFWRR